MMKAFIRKSKPFLLLCTVLAIGCAGEKIGFSMKQCIALSVFSLSIIGALFFWESRLSFLFFGTGVLLITGAVDLENIVKFASLDVIFFIIGMMILIGMLNDAGLFYFIITRLLRAAHLTGVRLFMRLMFISAILSGLMGEVASIVIMTKIILDISDFFEIDPVPLLISSVLATNIGSSGTLLGNPIGILIAARGNLSFEDFLIHAFPITILVLVASISLLRIWFRKYIGQLNRKIKDISGNSLFLSLITISPDRKLKVSVGIFLATLLVIALHRRLELFFGIQENALLLIIPLVSAGIALFYRSDRMRHYIEHDVEWMSILFFLFLFAQAGAIKYSGISDFFAKKLIESINVNPALLSGVILFSSGILSSILDNTVVVAAYIPVIQSLTAFGITVKPLWWAILFGACYGGNITVIGSTANIVAMDILEKKKKMKIGFARWIKIGLVVGIFSMFMAYALILLKTF
ncbi:MAG: SLC13 family permease [Candidatus Omnitrophota bacterium]